MHFGQNRAEVFMKEKPRALEAVAVKESCNLAWIQSKVLSVKGTVSRDF
jgi:hypothetical protein